VQSGDNPVAGMRHWLPTPHIASDESWLGLLCADLWQQNDFAVGVPPLEFVESVSDLVDRKGGGNVEIAGAGCD
jgi:hypothetical protein